MGLVPLSKKIQIDSMDDDLRNGLWNAIHSGILSTIIRRGNNLSAHYTFTGIFTQIWADFLKIPVAIPTYAASAVEELADRFEVFTWHRVYDFVEFMISVARANNGHFNSDKIEETLMVVLERECSGYRVIDHQFAPITNPVEIAEIDEAMQSGEQLTALGGANTHLKTALTFLSDKQRPDYRNSIKESISAVESACKVIAQKKNAELSSALDRIKGKLEIHAALEQGFKKIYGYTSDEGGIRHALTEESLKVEFEDAKFMLISCSAFINYLVQKADRAGIPLVKFPTP